MVLLIPRRGDHEVPHNLYPGEAAGSLLKGILLFSRINKDSKVLSEMLQAGGHCQGGAQDP